MIVRDLIAILQRVPSDLRVFVRNMGNPCGNITEIDKVEETVYGFFGQGIPCVILDKASLEDDNEL